MYSQQTSIPNNFSNQPNPFLIAGFFSAIEHFAQEFAKNSVDTIEMGEYKIRFTLNDKYQSIFCLAYKKVDEEQKYKHLLNTLKALFIHKFKTTINKKVPDLNIFKKFDPLLSLIFEAFEIKNEIINVEHFICGYLSQLRDFQDKNGLTCPKCKVSLKEEGVDYRTS